MPQTQCHWILSLEQEPPIENVNNENLFSLLFRCNGDAASNEATDLIFKNDLRAVLSHQNYATPKDVEIFNFEFDDQFPVEILIKLARTNIQKLCSSTIDTFGSRINTFFMTRESVTKLMLILRCNFNDLRWGDDNQGLQDQI